MKTDRPPVLEMRGVHKEFPGVMALGDVDFQAYPGEIHALIGENGAGKTTLMKILAGVHTADQGEILLDGKPVRFRSPLESRAAGINLIYQELNLVPHLTVAENIFLGNEPRWGVLLNRTHQHEAAAAVLERLGATFAPNTPVSHLSVAEEQLTEIARAIAHRGRVLVMDEPTSSLSERETEKLFEVICQLRDEGTAIIYISHRMSEVYSLADRVTVLRDGRCVGTLQGEEISTSKVIAMMAGRFEHLPPPKRRQRHQGRTVLEVRDLSDANRVKPTSFNIASGEILGLTGLVGSGRSELARLIVAADRRSTGEILLDGRARRITSPTDALQHGIAYVPEHRKEQGLFLEMTAHDNALMSVFHSHTRFGLSDRSTLASLYQRTLQRLRVTVPTPQTTASELSGGNQQKLLLARSLATHPRVLILDEPTRGVDITSKAELYALLLELAANGTAILMISADLPEILELCDRALVMREGEIVAELDPAHGDELSQESILAFATGLRHESSAVGW